MAKKKESKKKTNTRTIKLKISPMGSVEEKDATWKRVRQIAGDSWRAANWIVRGQFLNDNLMSTVRDRFGVDSDDAEAVSATEESFYMYFGVKRQATTERDIKSKFPDLPPCVTNPLNQVVSASYRKDKEPMAFGDATLRTYKKGMPFVVTASSIKFESDESFRWSLGRKDHCRFSIYYGRDKGGFQETVKMLFDGDKQFGAPSFQLKGNDLYLLIPVKDEVQDVKMIPGKCVGVDLGISIPVTVALSSGKARKLIGDINEFLRVRVQMQERRRRLQRSLSSAKGGHGRKKKLKALNDLQDKERKFVRTYNHFLSKTVVDFAIQNMASVIKMEFLEGYGKDKDGNPDESKKFFLRNWSFFELQLMIEQKAKKYGISVVKVDPYHTSQTCSKCGNYEPGQRLKQDKFKCLSCGEELNADYNAAVNIARSNKIVTKQEQCEYWKLKKAKKEAKTETKKEVCLV